MGKQSTEITQPQDIEKWISENPEFGWISKNPQIMAYLKENPHLIKVLANSKHASFDQILSLRKKSFPSQDSDSAMLASRKE